MEWKCWLIFKDAMSNLAENVFPLSTGHIGDETLSGDGMRIIVPTSVLKLRHDILLAFIGFGRHRSYDDIVEQPEADATN